MKKLSLIGIVLAGAMMGCSDPNTAELVKAKTEAEVAKAEILRLKADADATKLEMAKLKAELERYRSVVKTPMPEEPHALEQKFLSLKANYTSNAITVDEWTKLKAKVIEEIPAEMSPSDKRSLGQRMIDLRKAYQDSAITVDEWTKIKNRLLTQSRPPNAPPPSLDAELTDLKKAYEVSALTVDEWTRAKAEMIKIAK